MTEMPDITRPPQHVVAGLRKIGAATVSATLARLGIRNAHITGCVSFTPGRSVAGPALTLQFMPKREDIHGEGEYLDPEKQLHRHVLYHTRAGDMVVVDARGDLSSGVFGEMMLTYFKGRGGIGVVIDGCIRDFPQARALGLGLWLRSVTPNFHTQTNIFPYAVNVPIAMNNCFVAPGDIIVADDDGAVVVPSALASPVIEQADLHHEWEDFSRMKLSEGGDLRRYYPLSDAARPEYAAWRARNPKK